MCGLSKSTGGWQGERGRPRFKQAELVRARWAGRTGATKAIDCSNMLHLSYNNG